MKILQKLIATGLIALLNLTSIAQAAETVTYFHNDLLGSPAAATDESGEIIWRENYRPFGEKVKNQDEKTDNVIGYTGHVHDEDTGLTYMQARYYDPVIGRFYANDPVGFVEESPVSFNRYAYANNNPYKFVDPDGRIAETTWDAFNVGIGALSFSYNISNKNWGAAAVDALGLAIDAAATGVPFVPGGASAIVQANRAGKAADDIVRGANEAAERLGVNLNDVNIVDGMAKVRIGVADNINLADINKLKDLFKSLGAKKVEVDTGYLANEKLDDFLKAHIENGRQLKGGGKVRESDTPSSDYTIEYDLE